MSVQELSAPARPPSSIAPAQERATYPSNTLGDATTTKPLLEKASSKVSKRTAFKRAKTAALIDPPARKRARNRYEPYQRTEPTPEREAILPADPEKLETLDATTKRLYKSDLEVLKYVKTLKYRTVAVLEHVNRTDSQLRACMGAMGRIDLYMARWEKIEDRWTSRQLFGNGDFDEASDGDDEDAP